eukprot:526989-Alexandrium_andersonii.AAC.1
MQPIAHARCPTGSRPACRRRSREPPPACHVRCTAAAAGGRTGVWGSAPVAPGSRRKRGGNPGWALP